MSAEIKSIRIALGETETELTLQEARDLKRALEEIFPEPKGVDFVPMPRPYPVPVWPYRGWERVWGSGTVTGRLDSDSGALLLSARNPA